MKNVRRIALYALITVCAVTVPFAVVGAQTPLMTDEQVDRIRTSCVSAKNILNQLHTSDTLLRVNRGQIYEYMSTKLMDRFNGRVTSNRYKADDLSSITNTYASALTAFRLSYQSYEEQVSKALSINCSKEPVSFYDAVATARIKRTQVHTDVLKLHQHIDEYRTAVDTFETDFITNGGVR
jgi:hypothetical protein